MRKLICFFLIIISQSLTAQVPKSWFVVENKNFCVAFPSKPKHINKKIKYGGFDVETFTWSIADEKVDKNWARCFYLVYHNYPSKFFNNFPKKEYLTLLKQTVEADSIFSYTKNIGINNFPKSGIEVSGYNFKQYKYNFLVRFYLIGNRLYRLYASETDSLSYDARLFFNSFEVHAK